ncbi:hypothetical protein FACS189468_7520 [Spirochaetia bacterium]|nr:hypothetical protein FACS189468_7520 [Spirochaetia bacterium]
MQDGIARYIHHFGAVVVHLGTQSAQGFTVNFTGFNGPAGTDDDMDTPVYACLDRSDGSLA